MSNLKPPEPDYSGIWYLVIVPAVLAFVLYSFWPSQAKREDFHRYMQSQQP